MKYRSSAAYLQMMKNLDDPDVPVFQADMLAHDHVDVRGTHPVYVQGMTGRELRFAPRSITVSQARNWVQPPVDHIISNKKLDAVRVLR